METHQRRKFINGIWVTGSYNDMEIVGRTFKHNKDHCVALVTELGGMLSVPFDSIKRIRKFTFVEKVIPLITSTLQRKKKVTAIEKHIVETLSLINRKKSKE